MFRAVRPAFLEGRPALRRDVALLQQRQCRYQIKNPVVHSDERGKDYLSQVIVFGYPALKRDAWLGIRGRGTDTWVKTIERFG